MKKTLLLFLAILSLHACKKSEESATPTPTPTTPTTTSNADLMQGTYSGNGKHLPGQIQLGQSPSCTSLAYLSYLEIGSSTLNINKIADDTVSMQFSSSAFNVVSYSRVAVTKTGNIISFSLSSASSGRLLYDGSYNTTTKYFSFAGVTFNPTFSYGASDCFVQYPYVIGHNFIIATGNYGYETIDHLEYTGTKN